MLGYSRVHKGKSLFSAPVPGAFLCRNMVCLQGIHDTGGDWDPKAQGISSVNLDDGGACGGGT